MTCVSNVLAEKLTDAERLMRGDSSQIEYLASHLIVPSAYNFVERPWGGMRIRDFKGLCALPEQVNLSGLGLGEAFELAAFDGDGEASAYPSQLRLEDGSVISLPALLRHHARDLLGSDFVKCFGSCFPLLPKTLDIRELLSVQGHPTGNVEAYIVIEAEPGATIRLGFREDIDAEELRGQLKAGLLHQRELVELLAPDCDLNALQRQLLSWFSERRSGSGPHRALPDTILKARDPERVTDLLDELKKTYWSVLDKMNVVPVVAGQVIFNATPKRLLANGAPASAEAHALGNPEQREILALEIRRPGPTFRAWDNVRFPIRPVDVDAAIDSLNLNRTDASEFLVEPVPVPGRPGVLRSIESDSFTIEHLRPNGRTRIDIAAQAPHSLHVLGGAIEVRNDKGDSIGRLLRGQSAIVPIGVGGYTVVAQDAFNDIVKVDLPIGA